MLEDRLDIRLSDEEAPSTLSNRWRSVARENAAEGFDRAANLIEDGLVKVSGADTTDVVKRLRTRANGVRSGTAPLKR